MARKGDHTAGRPHQRSRILFVTDPVIVMTAGPCIPAAKRSADTAEVPVEGKGYKNILELPDWLKKHGILVKSENLYQNGTVYLLDTCPFSSAHEDGANVIRFANGAVFAGYHPASCGGGKQNCRETVQNAAGTAVTAGAADQCREKGAGEDKGNRGKERNTSPGYP